jgi:hypothetical protein
MLKPREISVTSCRGSRGRPFGFVLEHNLLLLLLLLLQGGTCGCRCSARPLEALQGIKATVTVGRVLHDGGGVPPLLIELAYGACTGTRTLLLLLLLLLLRRFRRQSKAKVVVINIIRERRGRQRVGIESRGDRSCRGHPARSDGCRRGLGAGAAGDGLLQAHEPLLGLEDVPGAGVGEVSGW